MNFPDLGPEQMSCSCALDVAELGGRTLDDVAATLNVTREAVRMVVKKRLPVLRKLAHGEGS